MSSRNGEFLPLNDPPGCSEEIVAFRRQLKGIREQNRVGWESTRKLVHPAKLPETLSRLETAVRASLYSPSLQDILLQLCRSGTSGTEIDGTGLRFKALTGYPTTKAIRALCLFFGVCETIPLQPDSSDLSSSSIDDLMLQSSNPYDVLRHAAHPSLLDIGAGDLSFEEELVSWCEPWLQQSEKSLILHALDRLTPGSQLGGRYHAQADRLECLKRFPSSLLQFKFWGGMNMATLSTVKGVLPVYTIVTCHAPATPTFAYEPTRLSPEMIQAALIRTKGQFREVQWGKEKALEVEQSGRFLNFPAWKFEILGPLALLNLMVHRGQLCVLSAIDAEVFWELLAQLLEDERYRPRNVLFEPGTLLDVFGSLYTELINIPIGQSIRLDQLAALRDRIPCVSSNHATMGAYRFRSVEVRRGAVFEGIPSSFTARQFPHMSEEQAPWWLILVPERHIV